MRQRNCWPTSVPATPAHTRLPALPLNRVARRCSVATLHAGRRWFHHREPTQKRHPVCPLRGLARLPGASGRETGVAMDVTDGHHAGRRSLFGPPDATAARGPRRRNGCVGAHHGSVTSCPGFRQRARPTGTGVRVDQGIGVGDRSFPGPTCAQLELGAERMNRSVRNCAAWAWKGMKASEWLWPVYWA